MLKGVAAALRTRVKLPSRTTSSILASPACARAQARSSHRDRSSFFMSKVTTKTSRCRDGAAHGHRGDTPAPSVAAFGGTIFMTNEVGVSFGPNGPGTLFFTGGMLLR